MTSRRVSNKPWKKEVPYTSIGLNPSKPADSLLKKPTAVSTVNNPLIPQSILEIGQQRTIVFGIFSAIQAYKIYQLLWPEKTFSSEGFAIKYMFIDGIFLWLLPILRIPWLTFGSSVTVIQIIGMALFNIVLSSSKVSIPLILLSIYKGLFEGEISLSGSKIRSADLYDASSHFDGKYTVHIMPESTAVINPWDSTFCIMDEVPVSIPIRLNATDPSFLQLQYVDFDTLEDKVLNYTKKDLRKYKMDVSGIDSSSSSSSSKILYVSIPVEKPGLYRLDRVRDSSHMDVRLQGGDVLIPRCPTAYLVPENFDTKDTSDSIVNGEISNRCIGDLDSPLLVVDGVPPLKVKYSRSIKGKEALFSFQSVQPEHFTSPLLGGSGPDFNYKWSLNESLSWASAQRVDLDIATTLNSPGEWVYTIEELEDAFGNKIIYSDAYKGDQQLMTAKKLNYKFIVHSRPRVRFSGCDPENPIKLPQGKNCDLAVDIVGDQSGSPYIVEVERFPEDEGDNDDVLPQQQGQATLYSLSHMGGRISVKDAGIYKLKSVKGQYCSGEVIESSTCLVYIPPKPSINIDFIDIDDKCAGSIGMKADITLIGIAPFILSYKVLKDGSVMHSDSLRIDKTRHLFEFRPREAGQYTYEFNTLSDSIYKNVALDTDQWRFEHRLRVLAKASFDNSYTHQRGCSGDSVGLNVNFQGTAPFKLTYEIIQPNSRSRMFTEDRIEGESTQIVTPPLTTGGRYTISLKSVEDANGCKTPLEVSDAIIDIRRQRPWAAFLPIDGSMHVKTLQDRPVGLPLRLSGEGPWKVTYRFTDEKNESQEHYSTTLHRANGEEIIASKKGTYSLIEVNDLYCPGEVADGKEFVLSWFDRPSLSVVPSLSLTSGGKDRYFDRKEICEGDEDVFEVSLSGVAPFELTYDVSGPIKRSNKKLQVPTKFASIKMETSKAGTYEYTFKDVQDQLYNSKSWSGEKIEPMTVLQVVNAKPDAEFANKGHTYKTCLSSIGNGGLTNEQGIPMVFKGMPPFALTVHIKHESTGTTSKVTVQNIDEIDYQLKSLFKELGLGKHTVSIAKVVDGTGCMRDSFDDDDAIYIQVSDIPRITPQSERQDYCVGDRIGFNLNGVAPFEVIYKFNDKKQKASADSMFSRVASLPGTLQLVSLSDMSACGVNLQDSPLIVVHPLPSVKISHERSIQNINEGDQAELIFSFSGTPPFSFTYARSEVVGRPAKEKVVETHSVSNIDGYHYSIFTSIQGTYQVTSIEDAYCSARVD